MGKDKQMHEEIKLKKEKSEKYDIRGVQTLFRTL